MDIIVFDHLSDNSDNNENKAKHWLDMFLFHLIFLLYLFLALIKKKKLDSIPSVHNRPVLHSHILKRDKGTSIQKADPSSCLLFKTVTE